jgi:tRNA-binding protein
LSNLVASAPLPIASLTRHTALMHKLSDSAAPAADPIHFDQFLAVDIRCGTVIEALPFPEARKPAWKLRIDFGPGIGVKRSSAQITEHYRAEDLVGTKVAAVVNFPPRQIGPFMSEVLTVGFPDEQGRVVLVRPDRDVPDGARLF